MDSPFPGMDPYLEGFWNDVHGKLVAYIADDLNESLPARYRAGMQQRVIIADVEEPLTGSRYPDVAILDAPTFGSGSTAVLSSRALIREPAVLAFRPEPLKEYSVEIIDTKSDGKVVTAIEVLSPANKQPGDGRAQFKRKQSEYRAGGASRVDIDLLRGGKRVFDFPQRSLAPQQHKPYYVLVYRAHRPGECELYAIDVREPLPVIGIPLRAADPDVMLDLQPLIRRVYRNGRLPIDYSRPCDPPLEGADAEWAGQILGNAAAGSQRPAT
jgi:hypothetical protein